MCFTFTGLKSCWDFQGAKNKCLVMYFKIYCVLYHFVPTRWHLRAFILSKHLFQGQHKVFNFTESWYLAQPTVHSLLMLEIHKINQSPFLQSTDHLQI